MGLLISGHALAKCQLLPLYDRVEIAEQAWLRVLLLEVLVVPSVLRVVVERVYHVVTSSGILFK